MNRTHFAVYILFATTMVAAFQNCSKVNFQDDPNAMSGTQSQLCSSEGTGCVPVVAPICQFDGQIIQEGQSVKAYLNSTVNSGGVCAEQVRFCRSGSLTGSFAYSTCSVATAKSCLFNGQTIADGGSVTAYTNSTTKYNESCQPEVRVCRNGVLSGSYAYGSCVQDQPKSCLFNGQTIAHGQSFNAFRNSTVPYGSSCESQVRVCNNGELSGVNSYSSCSVGQASSCLFNGQTIAHGQKVNGFKFSAVSFGNSCEMEERLCNNGSLTGSHSYASCVVGQPSGCLFNGQTIAHGQSLSAYASSSVEYGLDCESQSRTCSNGVLSGKFLYSTCEPSTKIPVVRGEIQGGCIIQLDEKFKMSRAGDSVAWPMLSCDFDGDHYKSPSCEPGYKVIQDASIQMNCSTNPSTNLLNCYWTKYRCVNVDGPTDPSAYVKGQSYGGCVMQADQNFKAVAQSNAPAIAPAWPMLNCETDKGPAKCAEGFKVVKETPVQMNCSTSPSKTNVQNCYQMAFRCSKL